MLKIDGKREHSGSFSERLVVGVNGSGKTTTIAKLGYSYVKDSHAPARSGLDRLLFGQAGQKVSGRFAQRRSGRVGSLWRSGKFAVEWVHPITGDVTVGERWRAASRGASAHQWQATPLFTCTPPGKRPAMARPKQRS